MSAEFVTAMSSGMAALIVAVSVFLTAWRTGRKVEVAADKLAHVTEEQSVAQGEKLEEIHVLVNSRLTEALNEIAALKMRLGDDPTKEAR